MKLLDEITIIIPTHFRHKYLTRILNYYADSDFKIIVADSTDFEYQDKNSYKNIVYLHYPGFTYQKKMADVVSRIESSYVLLCADDDFIVPSSIIKSLNFLKTNKDYVVAHGRYLLFYPSNENNHSFIWRAIYKLNSITDEKPSQRLYKHFSNYTTPTFYAVHRTNILNKILLLSLKYTDDLVFRELLLTLLTAIYGKIKVLDIFYGAREYNGLTEGKTYDIKGLPEFIEDGSFNTKFKSFQSSLCKELINVENISKKDGNRLIKKAMNEYLKSSYLKIRMRTKWKKLLNKSNFIMKMIRIIKKGKSAKLDRCINMPQIPYKNKENEFYKEYIRINDILNNIENNFKKPR